VLIVAAMLLPLSGRDAAAQSAGVYIVAVDLDIVPSETAKFLEAMKENGELAIKEGGLPRVQHHGAGQRSEPRFPVRGLRH
jgi:hypothetical protein